MIGFKAKEATKEKPAKDKPVMWHALCPRCYPTQKPRETKTERYLCGLVRTAGKNISKTVNRIPDDACVVCRGLDRCDVCGLDLRWYHRD